MEDQDQEKLFLIWVSHMNSKENVDQIEAPQPKLTVSYKKVVTCQKKLLIKM